jgi:ribosome-associated heat shock protein Hsp15
MALAGAIIAEKGAGLRLDKFLWFSRLMPTRADAAKLCESRHLRLDGRVIDKAHATVRIGSVLSFPRHGNVKIVRVMQLPVRRGSACVAAHTYQDLSNLEKPAISARQRDLETTYAAHADA